MDENQYHSLSSQLTPVQCVFEKSILAQRTSCKQSIKMNIAEREIVSCSSHVYQQRCDRWLRLLREKARFSLQLSNRDNIENALPHGKEIKVQVGGIAGLREVLELGDDTEKAADIYDTLDCCYEKYAGFEGLPFDEIVRLVSQVRAR